MSEKMTNKSRVWSMVLLGMVMVAALTIWGCGTSGTQGYSDPSPTTTKSPAIIDASVLKGWIDEGKLNAPFGSKDRVVVVSTSSVADWTAKGHIPGAVRLGTDELAKDRIEGLALASSMMPDGPMMDGLVQRLGIDANTTIVFTLPKNSTLYYQAIAFWDFRYWGFARNRIKILNGGDDAWDVAGLALATDATEKYTASTYSVSKNPVLKNVVRLSIGEMISRVDALIAAPPLKDTWQLIDVRGYATSPTLTNALKLSGYTMYFSRLNGDATRNYVYPDRATLETRMATISVDSATSGIYASPTKKTVVMCQGSSSAAPSFVLFDAVLNVPEGDISMYDGSASQWNYYSSERLLLAYPSASAAQRDAWSFNTLINPRAQGAMATSAVTVWSVFSPVLGPTHPDMNQIENADKAYLVPTATSPTPTTGSGSTGGGC